MDNRSPHSSRELSKSSAKQLPVSDLAPQEAKLLSDGVVAVPWRVSKTEVSVLRCNLCTINNIMINDIKKRNSVFEKMQTRYYVAIFITLYFVLIITRFGGIFSFSSNSISALWLVNTMLFLIVFMIQGRQKWITLLLSLLTYTIAELWIGYHLS